MNKLSNHGTKIFAVPGNCDPDDVEGKIIDSNAICIHDNVVEYENLVIYGFGGSNPTPFDTPGEVDEETLYKSIKKVLDSKDINLVKESSDEFPNGRISILVTHAPPKNTEARHAAVPRAKGGLQVNSISMPLFYTGVIRIIKLKRCLKHWAVACRRRWR